MVVYFSQFADLQEVALKIMNRLEGCPAHGVPFTAELANHGLLSWGIDPPRELTPSPGWEARAGGASSVTGWRWQLSRPVLGAGMSLTALPPSRNAAGFAIQRLRLEGIDTDTWTPAHGFAWAS